MSEITLGALRGFTIVTPDLGAALRAYDGYLDYRGPAPERVGPELAERWRAPAAAAAMMAELRPACGGDRFLRLIEGDPGGFAPFRSFGWAAAEIVVDDLDRVADRLAASPFRIIGEPAVLDFDFTDQIRAMQVQGPGGEVLYLTEIGAQIPGFDLPSADCLVGIPFIAVLGGPSVETLAAGYAALGRAAGPVIEARIQVLSRAHGLRDTVKHRLSTVPLPDRSLIEIDDFPATCTARPVSSIGLPAGIAMVSFAATAKGRALDQPALLVGAAGEWIELLP